MSERVYIALGSNIDPHVHVIRALEMLRGKFSDLRLSPIFRTPAEGFAGDFFLNFVVMFDTRMTLAELLKVLREMERRGGRRREKEIKGQVGARTLDIDLLMYGDLFGIHDGVQLPRPEIVERRFVWQPLAEIMVNISALNPVEDNIQKQVLKLWEDRPTPPEGFERTHIPGI